MGSSLRSRRCFLCPLVAGDPSCHFHSGRDHSDELSLMTLAGSALWCSVLTWFGQNVLTREMIDSRDATALIKAVKESGNFHIIIMACVVITVLYLLVVSLTGKKRTD